MTDRFSDAFLSVSGYLSFLFLARALPSLGTLAGGRNYPGAIGGLLGALVGVLAVFFIAVPLFRYLHRGGRRPWKGTCKAACWAVVAFVVFASISPTTH
jgi:chromate transport protein ChrA